MYDLADRVGGVFAEQFRAAGYDAKAARRAWGKRASVRSDVMAPSATGASSWPRASNGHDWRSRPHTRFRDTPRLERALLRRAFWSDVFTEPFWGYTHEWVTANARIGYRVRALGSELWVAGTNLFDDAIKSHVFGDIVRRKVTDGIRWQWP